MVDSVRAAYCLTSNPNFSKAEITIEIWIYRLNKYQYLQAPEVHYLIICLKNLILQFLLCPISTRKGDLPEVGIQS